jgi:type VII secretion integral membrane protein EccD
MSTALQGEVCRITVVGPDRRVDLAVPVTSTVASLVPVLLAHTADQSTIDAGLPPSAWVLQRLGGAAFDHGENPQSLDWLEGETFHLRPAVEALPALDFDDLAEGIADMVNRRRDRWQPAYRRHLFIGVSGAVLAVLAAVLFWNGDSAALNTVGAVLAAGFVVASVLFARYAEDGALAVLFGVGACCFAAFAAVNLVDGDPAGVLLRQNATVAAAAAMTVAVLLTVFQRLWAPALLYSPFLVLTSAAIVVIGFFWLRNSYGLNGPGAAALVASVVFASVIFAPNLVLRAARLRGPQLPKTGEELQYDIEPHQAQEVQRRSDEAHNFLSAVVVCACLVLPVLSWNVLAHDGWVSSTFVLMLSSALLLRARVFMGLSQRVALTVAGIAGYAMLIAESARAAEPGRLNLLVGVLLVALAVAVLAALRPWPRRLLPIWEFIARILDVVTALAVLPLALYLMGVYAWARGLGG